MKYHVICEEERAKDKKLLRPRIDRILDTNNWQEAYQDTKNMFPKYKTIRVYKCDFEKKDEKEKA